MRTFSPLSVSLASLTFLTLAGCTTFNFDPPPSARQTVIAEVDPEVRRLPVLRLPNLGVARPSSPVVTGNGATVDVTVRNEGAARSGDFDVRVEAWVGPVMGPVVAAANFTTTVRCGGLAPAQECTNAVGPIPLPPIAQRPVDVLVRVIADPPTTNRPGGEIWESDENNNFRERGFTIY